MPNEPTPKARYSTESSPQDQRHDRAQTSSADERLTTNQGVRVDDTDNSLTAGVRGPALLQDFHLREKMTHFDHERIPERVVHARGSAAHGYFQPYRSLQEYTSADFLSDPSVRTPVFVRFSTVVGSRGSADTVRDVRGFATKFYTRAGNFDLVANNMPVFFIQDAIKFPDLVHAIKPEPQHEMPQASAAHDTFWDFVSLTPESMHMIMWVLSDRALPRSFRMMDGFGVHTFRFVNAQGQSTFVKFHWRALLGAHALVWDEVQKAAGKDPDFNRRDLWEAIEAGDYPEYELAVQLVPESDEHRFDFDLLDPTKIIPEEEVPLLPVGKMVLNRNPKNFFAETEQVAFHPGHLVPGIDVTNDPLLQGRLFSYLDTQLLRLGGPNFAQIPVNRPTAPVSNNQRDGFHRQSIDAGQVAYSPNSLGGGAPRVSDRGEGGYEFHAERVDGDKIRQRSPSFQDHYSQATLFWNSQSEAEQQHLVEAIHFELGKVTHRHIRHRMIEHFNRIDHDLALRAAAGIGVPPPQAPAGPNHGRSSAALSMTSRMPHTIATRRVAVLAGDGVLRDDVEALRALVASRGAKVEVISRVDGTVDTGDGDPLAVDKPAVTTASVMYDAVFIPGGEEHARALTQQGDVLHFVNEAFKHGKTIGGCGAGVHVLRAAKLEQIRLAGSSDGVVADHGVVSAYRPEEREAAMEEFVSSIHRHRHWDRAKESVPA